MAAGPCHTETVKYITVAVPDDVSRGARIRAAERGASVSAMVSEYLSLVSKERGEEEFAGAGYDGVRVENPFRNLGGPG